MKITNTYNITDKKDLVRANNDAKAVTDFKNEKVKVSGIIFGTVTNKDGDEVKTVVIKTSDGDFIGTISPTMVESMEVVADVFEEEIAEGAKDMDVIIKTGKSNAGREYYYASI